MTKQLIFNRHHEAANTCAGVLMRLTSLHPPSWGFIRPNMRGKAVPLNTSVVDALFDRLLGHSRPVGPDAAGRHITDPLLALVSLVKMRGLDDVKNLYTYWRSGVCYYHDPLDLDGQPLMQDTRPAEADAATQLVRREVRARKFEIEVPLTRDLLRTLHDEVQDGGLPDTLLDRMSGRLAAQICDALSNSVAARKIVADTAREDSCGYLGAALSSLVVALDYKNCGVEFCLHLADAAATLATVRFVAEVFGPWKGKAA